MFAYHLGADIAPDLVPGSLEAKEAMAALLIADNVPALGPGSLEAKGAMAALLIARRK